jgi:hypothetical protein
MIRRSAAEHIEDDTILDDFVLGIRPFRHGLDVVNEPRATVFTQTETEQLEWKRKARISGGNLQALLRHVDLLHPRYGRKAWVYFSHKVIRMYIPFLLFTMLVGSAIKIGEPFFAVLFALQAAVLATVPLLWTVRDKLRKLLIPQYYYYINIALVVGYWRYFFRPERYWKKTPRKGEYGTSR